MPRAGLRVSSRALRSGAWEPAGGPGGRRREPSERRPAFLSGPLLARLVRGTELWTKSSPGTPVIDIGLSELRESHWAEDLGDFQPVTLAIVADTRLALPALRELVRARLGDRDRAPRRKQVEAPESPCDPIGRGVDSTPAGLPGR